LPQFGPKIALIRFENECALDVNEPLNAIFVAHSGELHNAVAGLDSWVGSFPINGGKQVIWPLGASVAAFQQGPNQLTVLYVEPSTGRLYAQWRFRDAGSRTCGQPEWGGPSPILPAHPPTLPGASLAISGQGPNKWFVVFVDKDGNPYSASVEGGSVWQDRGRLIPSIDGFAEPGGNVVAIEQAPGLVSALFVAKSSPYVHVCWRETNAEVWSGPAPIHSALPPAPPGAGIAAARLPGDRWWVFYVDDTGTLMANRVVSREPWQAPEVVSAANIAPPGALVAATNQTDWLLNAFVVGLDGSLLLYWLPQDATHWAGPHKLTPSGFAPPGAAVTAAKQNDDVTVVVCAAIDGRPYICWVAGTGDWQGPARISWSRVTVPDVRDADAGQNSVSVLLPTTKYVTGVHVPASTIRLAQLTGLDTLNPLEQWGGRGVDLGANTDHKTSERDPGRLYIFSGDVTLPEYVRDPDLSPPWDADLVAYTEETRIRPGGFPLRVVSDLVREKPPADGFKTVYHPFTVERLGILGTNETPTGAFSYDGRVYVFIMAGGTAPTSYLTSSDRPDQLATFELRFKFSWTKFWQIAPAVVQNAEHPGLPAQTGDGLVMVGQGAPAGGNHENVYLAWMPLEPGRLPDRARMLFYAGKSPARRGHRYSWSPREEDAAILFTPRRGYTAVSLMWLLEPRRWILLYSLAKPPKDPNPDRRADGPIVARVAASPMWWSEEIVLLDWYRDLESQNLLWNSDRWAYGAFILNRFTHWLPASSRVRIRYLLSLGEPYELQLVESQIHLPDVPVWRRILQMLADFLLRNSFRAGR
jgi:hypothetical protein